MAKHNRVALSILFLLFGLITGCGDTSSGGYTNEPLSGLEKQFREIAVKHRIPYRLLLAVGYVESRLSPTYGFANYMNNETTNEEAKKSLPLVETAFGLTRAKIGLSAKKGVEADLITQTEAYASFLRATFDKQQANLPDMPKTSDELFQWVWEIARLHRGDGFSNEDILKVFVKEIAAVLNTGFVWQQQTTGEVIRLKVANPTLDEAALSQASQQALALKPGPIGDILNARFITFSRPLGTDGNKPLRVMVVHCPLSLSGCLELQTQNDRLEVRMGAHYIIPRDDRLFQTALQVTPHDKSVAFTDTRGNPRRIKDKIVVMLVGNSGKLVNGQIQLADPSWLTHWQLTKMSEVIREVCAKLERDGVTNIAECTKVSSKLQSGKQVQFRKSEHNYQTWGDIPDFDEKIFGSYLEKTGTDFSGAASFEKSELARELQAGQDINLVLNYQTRAKLINVETLVRCSNGSLKWATVVNKQVRGQTRTQVSTQVYSKGPNKNGSHFFRAKVYGNNLDLMGWDFMEVFVRGFEEGPDLASYEECD